MLTLIDAGYLSAAAQGFAVCCLLGWRMLAVTRGESVTARSAPTRLAQITLLIGMFLGWAHAGLNNGWFGVARLTSGGFLDGRPEWVDYAGAVAIIKGLVIVAGPIHVYTFTHWKWGWPPVVIWTLLTVVLPFALVR